MYYSFNIREYDKTFFICKNCGCRLKVVVRNMFTDNIHLYHQEKTKYGLYIKRKKCDAHNCDNPIIKDYSNKEVKK